jgi:hypothetical protein
MRRGALLGILALAAAGALAQSPMRVRGPVLAVEDDTLSIARPGGEPVQVALDEKSQLLFMQPIALEDIKPGDFLGITSVKRADGTLSAIDVRRFPKPVSPGHRPLSGSDDQTMTNATVSATVQAAAGRELTMTYEGGTQRIVVPRSAYLSMLVPGRRSQLAPGSIVNLTAAPGPDGRLTALQVQFRDP